jgi:hypothetical protein
MSEISRRSGNCSNLDKNRNMKKNLESIEKMNKEE